MREISVSVNQHGRQKYSFSGRRRFGVGCEGGAGFHPRHSCCFQGSSRRNLPYFPSGCLRV